MHKLYIILMQIMLVSGQSVSLVEMVCHNLMVKMHKLNWTLTVSNESNTYNRLLADDSRSLTTL